MFFRNLPCTGLVRELRVVWTRLTRQSVSVCHVMIPARAREASNSSNHSNRSGLYYRDRHKSVYNRIVIRLVKISKHKGKTADMKQCTRDRDRLMY